MTKWWDKIVWGHWWRRYRWWRFFIKIKFFGNLIEHLLSRFVWSCYRSSWFFGRIKPTSLFLQSLESFLFSCGRGGISIIRLSLGASACPFFGWSLDTSNSTVHQVYLYLSLFLIRTLLLILVLIIFFFL